MSSKEPVMRRHRLITWFARALAAAMLAASMLHPAAAAAVQDRMSAGGLHYRIDGRGPDVVLIHAFHMDLREWDEVAAALASSRRVIRYDVRGHGRSEVKGPLPSTDADLLGLLDELTVARATLVGLSMGSTVAVDFALTHADRVDRLIAVSPSVPGVATTAPAAGPEWMRPILQAARHAQPRRAAELWWDSPLFALIRAPASASLRADRYRGVVMDNAKVWTLSTRPPPLTPPAGARLHELNVPVLTVAGESDPLGSLDIARSVASSVPDGRCVVIPGAGHMLSLERPGELTRLILSFEAGFPTGARGVAVEAP
jgi:3-oxoadipate enol-lactonase